MSNDPAERAVLMCVTSIRAAATTEYVRTVRANVAEVAADLNTAADCTERPPDRSEPTHPPSDRSGANPGRCVHPERTGRTSHEKRHLAGTKSVDRRLCRRSGGRSR